MAAELARMSKAIGVRPEINHHFAERQAVQREEMCEGEERVYLRDGEISKLRC
jgi:hypothetical protein